MCNGTANLFKYPLRESNPQSSSPDFYDTRLGIVLGNRGQNIGVKLKIKCEQCGKVCNKRPGDIKRTKHNYCSRSCSATANNLKQPRRKKTKSCANCSNKVLSAYKYCTDCKYMIYNDWDKICIKDIHSKAKYQVSAMIRQYARKIFKANHPDASCQICGYDKHMEVCHIKPINSYEPYKKVSIVNHIDNLVGLCPNCHWELDNGLLNLSAPPRN